ncbi:universal stress protein [Aestuariivivens sp. NBU2969]|uniref:universal stress protein n=1 Tax=Aestuariivivens sp. NBU2969 TaxID=2873267 RepID=UPI001CBBE15C|nr:universal stress protein [Aestuariivivens sp. NBU2969]
MKQSILIPTDFSDNAWNAIVYALKLFKDKLCTFYFLHATTIKVSTLSNLSNKLLKKMEQEAMDELLELKTLAESADANANHDFQIILSLDDLRAAVKKVVKEQDIDLVIMGTKGATGAKEFFIGSNTVHMAKELKDCPILIIPQDYDFIEPKQIAFPTDFNRFFSNKELKHLKELADLYDSKIRIMHISIEDQLNDIQEYNLITLKDFLDNYDYSIHWIPKYTNKATEIDDFIEELGIHILAMVNYKHSIVEKLINEPVIKKLGFHAKVPFMVIPE